MSHLNLWKKMIDNNLPYLKVFEDDVVLSYKINSMHDNIDQLLENTDIIKLETMKDLVLLEELTPRHTNNNMYKLKSAHMGMAAYIISKQCAIYLIQQLKEKTITKPIDNFMFEENLHNLNIVQLSPALAIQDDVLNPMSTSLKSTLESERYDRVFKPKKKLTFRHKLKREIDRLSFKNIKQEIQRKAKFKNYEIIVFEDDKL